MLRSVLKIMLALFFACSLANANTAPEKTTIKGLLDNSEQYTNKVVQASGKIVKISKAIMNTNWVHVQDEKGNKIIFRSLDEEVKVGEKVVATGTVNTNVDYGYGYLYPVIVVDSSFKKN